MLTTIQKWGHSFALRIPKAMAEEMQWTAGMVVDVRLEDGRLVITPFERPAGALDKLLAAITPENMHGAVDWGAPVGKES